MTICSNSSRFSEIVCRLFASIVKSSSRSRLLRKSLLRELDFTIEANNLHTISENLLEFEQIVIPQPVDDYTTTRVLTMEYIAGKKITALSPLRLLEIDGDVLH